MYYKKIFGFIIKLQEGECDVNNHKLLTPVNA